MLGQLPAKELVSAFGVLLFNKLCFPCGRPLENKQPNISALFNPSLSRSSEVFLVMLLVQQRWTVLCIKSLYHTIFTLHETKNWHTSWCQSGWRSLSLILWVPGVWSLTLLSRLQWSSHEVQQEAQHGSYKRRYTDRATKPRNMNMCHVPCMYFVILLKQRIGYAEHRL